MDEEMSELPSCPVHGALAATSPFALVGRALGFDMKSYFKKYNTIKFCGATHKSSCGARPTLPPALSARFLFL